MKKKILVGILALSMLLSMGALSVIGDVINVSAVEGDASTSAYDKYKVESLNPSNVKVNLFDYWTERQDAIDSLGKYGDPWKWPIDALVNENSINYNHALIFGQSNYHGKDSGYYAKWPYGTTYNAFTGNGNSINDSSLEEEVVVNTATGAKQKKKYIVQGEGDDEVTPQKRFGGPYQGILNRKLNEDGFPVLALEKSDVQESMKKVNEYYQAKTGSALYQDNEYPSGTESLDYLFNPKTKSVGKASYTDVTGLFQINEKGNYYYDSDKNWAYYNEDSNSFNLYDGRGAMSYDRGNFFPFTSPDKVFDIDEENDKLTTKSFPQQNRDSSLNHYFGLTMEADFIQPLDGVIRNGEGSGDGTPMTFEFFGDDDIWIFIDGVLVADLGGVHDYCYTKIDFQTGTVKIYRNSTQEPSNEIYKDRYLVQETTIYDQFNKADVDLSTGFYGDTFAANTRHKLQVFYLERGNYDSNLRLEFNLLAPETDKMFKVDQDGQALDGVEFELYARDDNSNQPKGDKLGTFTTDENGYIDFSGVDFEVDQHYLLRETKPKEGYVTTGDILLTTSQLTGLLQVENQWETGAVNSFEVDVYQAGALNYYSGDSVGDEGKDGLIVAVPFFSPHGEDTSTREGWQPLYGSVSEGFTMVNIANSSTNDSVLNEADAKKAALEAFIKQSQDDSNERWYLEYDSANGRYEGQLVDLPGSADRYTSVNKETGDLQVAYYLFNSSIFENCKNTEEKYKKILDSVGNTEDSIQNFVTDHSEDFKLLNISQFKRYFYNRLYVPNQVRELMVIKENEDGKALKNAVFTLYSDKDCKYEVAKGVTDENGELTFSAQNTGDVGINKGDTLSSTVEFALDQERNENGTMTDRSYWLKETKAPEGYDENETVIEVRITKDSLYVDAGDENDGVRVRKGVSKLLQTVTRYASSEDIDITLRDLTVTYYLNEAENGEKLSETQFNTSDAWKKIENSELNMHYGLAKTDGFEYGIHETNKKPYYETDTDWLAFGVKQNYLAHSDPNDEYYSNNAKQDIKNTDLSQLTPDKTAVIVTDKESLGSIHIVKKEVGNDVGYLVGAEFKLEKLIEDKDNSGELVVDESFKALVAETDKDGKIQFNNLKYGTYRITETKAPSGYIKLNNSIDVVLNAKAFAARDEESDLSYDTENRIITVTVFNEKALEIPETGQQGTTHLMIAGIGFVLTALAVYVIKRKREDKI